MRRLIFFVLGFVLAFALLINMGCAANVGSSILEGVMEGLEGPRFEENWKPKIEEGWQPVTQDGNHWSLYAPIGGNLNLIATCDYSYMKVSGVEKWRGRYFGMTSDLHFHGYVFDSELQNLSGCVEWVKMFYYGDYSI